MCTVVVLWQSVAYGIYPMMNFSQCCTCFIISCELLLMSRSFQLTLHHAYLLCTLCPWESKYTRKISGKLGFMRLIFPWSSWQWLSWVWSVLGVSPLDRAISWLPSANINCSLSTWRHGHNPDSIAVALTVGVEDGHLKLALEEAARFKL